MNYFCEKCRDLGRLEIEDFYGVNYVQCDQCKGISRKVYNPTTPEQYEAGVRLFEKIVNKEKARKSLERIQKDSEKQC